MFVLRRASAVRPLNAACIRQRRSLRYDCLHPRGNILIIPHQNRAGVAGNRLGQALPAALLHIAEHRAHQVDQVVDDALIGCGGQVVEGDQIVVYDRAVGTSLVVHVIDN
jgi:hypothetical protein